MNKPRLLIIAIICLLWPAIAAGQDREKLTVLLDWFVNPDHAPLFVAQEKGFFSKRGLDVQLIAPSNPNDPPKLVAAGKADLAVSYQHQHQMQVDQGLPLVRVATLIATPLNSLVVLADSGIDDIADLRGKTVGYSVGGFETVLLTVMLQQVGLQLSDVNLVNVNFSLSPSLLSGKVDGVIGAFRNFELNQLDLEGHPGRAFFVEEFGVPAYDELIVVANRDDLDRPELRAFVDALEEGVQYLVNHPDDSWRLFIGEDRGDLDDELNRRAWRDTLPRFALRPGALDRSRYLRFAAFLHEQEIIDGIAPLADWAVELE
ncbi:ABC transporter substrate-binding protein [Desulfofustis glycolicus]|uniref:Putative hydroxymethylpyrimidine transport system substrate-binding protein n=1 Tax=Desulfofustis glycolicus DSM 9705 TaxID=1121409 RepID=A0A1M5XE66_9BACT|nr:ABC transporter substrate-binding protein [Desulfofustis glycolicus]MCB2218539.1 ABC transporter substrate-binding protein [Desulfobulbaceae bacterium]SHH98175.1 putative hydroxymethylpyrimidine transport system substrate-binding protein [Desulfofustis glycolicus DSM 9705]